MKVTKVFKVIITACLVIAFTACATCKEAPAVEEQVVEGQATFETPPTEEEQKEEIPPKTEEEQKEFTQDMIKNHLIFPEHVAYLEPWMKAGEPVPLWYVQSWSGEGLI